MKTKPKKLSDEDKQREGALVAEAFDRRSQVEPSLTQESLMDEISRTQGLFHQWIKGKTPIPDKSLIWLGGRLQFDPFEVRPSLQDLVYGGLEQVGRAGEIRDLVRYLTLADNEEFERAARILKAALPAPPSDQESNT